MSVALPVRTDFLAEKEVYPEAFLHACITLCMTADVPMTDEIKQDMSTTTALLSCSYNSICLRV